VSCELHYEELQKQLQRKSRQKKNQIPRTKFRNEFFGIWFLEFGFCPNAITPWSMGQNPPPRHQKGGSWRGGFAWVFSGFSYENDPCPPSPEGVWTPWDPT
jgi:hypothetical protein